jgi:hypothetical protein
MIHIRKIAIAHTAFRLKDARQSGKPESRHPESSHSAIMKKFDIKEFETKRNPATHE